MALYECTTVTDKEGKELLEHGTALFPIACYRDDMHKGQSPGTGMRSWEAAVVVKGRALIEAGTEKAVLEQGDGFFINTGILHSAKNAGRGECILHSMCFQPWLVGGNKDSIFWTKYVNPLLADRSAGLVCLGQKNSREEEAVRLIEEVWETCVKEPSGYEFDVRHGLSRLICILLSGSRHINGQPDERYLRVEMRMKDMLQYIRKNYAGEMKMKGIAESAMVSVSECLRCFRSTIGTTPIQYVKQYRIQKAAELLHSTAMSISEIGGQCGFSDMSYFSKEFRKAYACTPSEYRSRQAILSAVEVREQSP